METILVPFHLDEPVFGLLFPDAKLVDPRPLPKTSPWERLAAIYEPVAAAVAKAKAPLVVSADCTTSLGILAGLQRKGHDPAIVWLDAHGDFNTHETTPSGYLGGMPLALAVGRGDHTVRDSLGLRPIREERVLLADARDLDVPERKALDGSRVRRAEVSEIPDRVPDGEIYLHIDLDVLNPDEILGLRFPVPAGLPLATLASALRRVADTGRVVGVGLACTFYPERTDAEQVTRVLDAIVGSVKPT